MHFYIFCRKCYNLVVKEMRYPPEEGPTMTTESKLAEIDRQFLVYFLDHFNLKSQFVISSCKNPFCHLKQNKRERRDQRDKRER